MKNRILGIFWSECNAANYEKKGAAIGIFWSECNAANYEKNVVALKSSYYFLVKILA